MKKNYSSYIYKDINYKIIEYFSICKKYRYSKEIIINDNDTNKICILMQNPSNDLHNNCKYNKIINFMINNLNNVNSIIIINLFARQSNNINEWKDIRNVFMTEEEIYNTKYIKKILLHTKYKEIYLAYGQHSKRILLNNIFRPRYLEILKILFNNTTEYSNFKKFHINYVLLDKYLIPGYPFPYNHNKNLCITNVNINLIYQYLFDNL